MRRVEYKEGDKLGSCIYLKEVAPSTHRRALFLCSCGKEFEDRIDRIKRGDTLSCGCLRDTKIQQQGRKNITHNRSYHPIFPVWAQMIHRCEKPNQNSYPLYGGRGIKVCERWHDVNNFIEDMYPTYIKGLVIDRINNDGNYEPSNCRWVTQKENSNNRRSNKIFRYKNEDHTISQWCDILGIPYQKLQGRLRYMSVDRAVERCLNII